MSTRTMWDDIFPDEEPYKVPEKEIKPQKPFSIERYLMPVRVAWFCVGCSVGFFLCMLLNGIR